MANVRFRLPLQEGLFQLEHGKAEKCILCYPRLETGQAPACFHSCPGRIRYLGVVLYDADRIEATASRPDNELVEAQREMILDPFDAEVIRQARANGIDDKVIESAQQSPTLKYVKRWKLALPLHPEWRTLPMLFYVPPLLPVTASLIQGNYELTSDFFSSLESARLPIRYMASLFSANDEQMVIDVYKKLFAVRLFKRFETVGDIPQEQVTRALEETKLTPEEIEEIYYLTSVASFDERMVIPPSLRETAIEMVSDTQIFQEEQGVGFVEFPKRGL